MTTAVAPKRRREVPAPKTEKKTSKPKLRVVDQASVRRTARRRFFMSLSILGLVITFFAVALLYAQLIKGQQNIDELRSEITEAEAAKAELERNIAIVSTPEAIVSRAEILGMVRAVDPQYLVAVRSAKASAAGS